MKKKTFWVDLPNPKRTDENDSWVSAGEFGTRREAQEFLFDNYGIPKHVANFFISVGDFDAEGVFVV
jgi:hypothetical protein